MENNMQQINVPSLLRIKPGALDKLGHYLNEYMDLSRIALFYGTGMEKLLGDRVSAALKEGGVEVCAQHEIGNIDFEHISELAFSLPSRVKALVAVGGGTVIDCAKYCGYLLRKSAVSVPTAISNDAFCSPGASLRVGGRRRSLPSLVPAGLIIDTDVILSSPRHFTYSGIGDVISNLTAIDDWKAAVARGTDSANDLAKFITLQSTYSVINFPVKDLGNVPFIQTIAVALAMSGVAMTVAGSSRPASGSEHLISHAYDSLAEKPSLHGLQVGLAAYLCSHLQRNKHHELMKNFLEEAGFFAVLKERPLHKETFLASIEKAPSLKEDHYTILSEPDSLERARRFVEEDPLMRDLLV